MNKEDKWLLQQLEKIDAFKTIEGRINGIISFIENPCNEPWVAVATAAQPWAGQAAAAFLGVDFMQTVRTALSPGGNRGSRHMRGNAADTEAGPKAGKEKLPGFPDPFEYFGHQAKKPIEQFIKANSTWGTKAIFTGVNIVESGLWQIMLIDQASKFVYHSIADARRSAHCEKWWNGDGLRSGPMLGGIIPGWSDMSIPDQKYFNLPVSMPFHGAQVGTGVVGELSLTASFSGLAVGGTGAQLHGLQIFDSHSNQVVATTGIQPFATGEPVEFTIEGRGTAPCILSVQKYQAFGTLAGEGILFARFMGGTPADPHEPARKARHLQPPRKKKPGGPKQYGTSDNQTVYDYGKFKLIKPNQKP
jgi:hypothetical protein